MTDNIHTAHHGKGADGRSREIEGYIEQSLAFLVAALVQEELTSREDNVGSFKHFLDIGCDYGYAGAVMAHYRSFDTIHGIDPYLPSNSMHALNNQLFKRTLKDHFLSVGSEAYDVLFMNHVLEHFTDPIEEMKYLSIMARPGAVMFVAVPDADSPWALWEGHYTIWTTKWLNRFMEMHGWRVITEPTKRCFRGENVENWACFRKV